MRSMIMLVFVAISTLGYGQVKKQVKESVKTPTQDSITIKFTRAYDTTKLRITLFVEDGSLTWVDGYQIKGYLIVSKDDVRESGEVMFKDKKFLSIRQEDIQNLAKVNWK